MTQLVALVLAALVGAIAGILTTAWKTRKDLEAQYDIDLRKRRIEAYRALWKELEILADYSPPGELTHDGLRALSMSLRQWYFQRGGLFLSLKTRGPYFNLQQALTAISSGEGSRGSERLDEYTGTVVKTLASRLRTSTTDDVATRVGPRLAPSLGTRIKWRWRRVRTPVWAGVERRWAWRQGRPEPCYFVLLQNRSDREVEVTKLELDGVAELRVEPGLPLLVQAGEPRELAVLPKSDTGAIGRVVRVTITLAGGRRLESQDPPDVPIRTDVLTRALGDEHPAAGSP